MNYFFLNAVVSMDDVMNNGMSIGEKFSYSGRIILIGLGTVFSVLIILWVLLELLGFITRRKSNKKVKSQNRIEQSDSTKNIIRESDNTLSSNSELVAIITSSIESYISSKSNDQQITDGPKNFKVVSFKRISK